MWNLFWTLIKALRIPDFIEFLGKVLWFIRDLAYKYGYIICSLIYKLSSETYMVVCKLIGKLCDLISWLFDQFVILCGYVKDAVVWMIDKIVMILTWICDKLFILLGYLREAVIWILENLFEVIYQLFRFTLKIIEYTINIVITITKLL